MKIVEIDKSETDKNFNTISTPLSYRVSIKISYGSNDVNDRLQLKREYFYVGYNDGEVEDGFYFDNKTTWSNIIGVTRATFYTRKLDDKNYLIQKEKELIKLFYEELIKSEEGYKQELKEQTEDLNRAISLYQEYQMDEAFIKILRKNKLNEINESN